jgi:hypothetical protein
MRGPGSYSLTYTTSGPPAMWKIEVYRITDSKNLMAANFQLVLAIAFFVVNKPVQQGWNMSSTLNPGRVAGFWYLLLIVIGPLRLIYIPSKLSCTGTRPLRSATSPLTYHAGTLKGRPGSTSAFEEEFERLVREGRS